MEATYTQGCILPSPLYAEYITDMANVVLISMMKYQQLAINNAHSNLRNTFVYARCQATVEITLRQVC